MIQLVKRCMQWLCKNGDGVLLVAGLAGLLVLATNMAGPLANATEIGGDEHFEVNKAFLWANGFPLYTRIWSDQPPLFTVLLGLLFQAAGPTIIGARLLSVFFGFLLLGLTFILVSRKGGRLAGFLAALALIAAPSALELSVSAMQQVPSTAMALASLGALDCWRQNRRLRWLLVSACLLAAALDIKLTAALMAPALLVEILLTTEKEQGRAWVLKKCRVVLIWGTTVGLVFVGGNVALGNAGLDLLWRSHFSAYGSSDHYGFSILFLRLHSEVPWAALVGVVLLVLQQDWRRLAFPGVFLATVTIVHVMHRPWWFFYHLDFALPLAWLAGYGVADLFRLPLAGKADPVRKFSLVPLASIVAGSFLLSAIGHGTVTRLISEVRRIGRISRVQETAVIDTMKKFRDGTHFAYTKGSIFPFHAGLMVPPELAVLSLKRRWSGRITDAEILETVRRYRPEQLLIEKNSDEFLTPFAATNYTVAYDDGWTQLYVTSQLFEKSTVSNRISASLSNH